MGLQRGYAATAMTDGGHEGGGASFAAGHPEKLVDFGNRSVHEMAVIGKAMVKAFYGEDPKLSYFNGCSQGGRQALKEVQMYPTDFDGVVAGRARDKLDDGRAMHASLGRAGHPQDRRQLRAEHQIRGDS